MPSLPDPTEPGRRAFGTDRLLPAGGRPGGAPPWPSGHVPGEEEAREWTRLWSLPQGAEWEPLGASSTVERLARLTCLTSQQLDSGEVSAALVAQIARLENDLGLTPTAMARLRWSVVESQPKPKRRPAAPIRRRRLRAAPETEE